MTISLSFRLGLLTLGLIGCSTSPRHSETGRYLASLATARFDQPVAIQVIDQRPWTERQATSSSGYNHSTGEAGETGRVAALFAHDLIHVLETKKMASEIRTLLHAEPAPPGFALLQVRLLSWFGRVPDSTATAKATSVLFGNTAFYGEGQCRFDAELTIRDRHILLGHHEAKVRLQVDADASVEREGRQVSAQAADEAMAAFVRRLEVCLNEIR